MKLERIAKNKSKKINDIVGNVINNSEFCEDISFLVPQILNYYGVIDEKTAILPYASVGIVFDSVKFINNMVDIIYDGKNMKKLQEIKLSFGGDNLNKEIEVICKKNQNRELKNSILNLTRTIGDGLCFSVPTWIYGESVKVSSSVAEIIIEMYKYIRQKGRNKAKEKGDTSFYAKIFNMEKSTDDKIRQKCEIIRLVDEEIQDYTKTEDYFLKNKKFQKLDLYVKILYRYKKNLGVKKNWNKILKQQEKNWNAEIQKEDESITKNNECIKYYPSAVDVWQFQRIALMLDFLNDAKNTLFEISKKYSNLGRLKKIKKDIKKDKQKYVAGEYDLVNFLIKHNKRKLKNISYKMTILGGNILGEVGELVSHFKKTTLEITGIFAKLFSTVFSQGIKIKEEKKKANKKITKYAGNIVDIVKSVESLSLEYEKFYSCINRLNVYLSEIDLTWKDVANKKNAREIIENALT